MSEQICTKCTMDTTVPRITFDLDGVCNYCYLQNELELEYPIGPMGDLHLENLYGKIRVNKKNKQYDCIVGISGGRDSTYLLYHLTKEAGLNCLAVHFNDGFGNPVAGENMQKMTRKLGVDLRTISADWRESKDIKLACLKSSTPDLNLGVDLGLGAALYGVATAENIKYVFIGQSFRTEGIAPLEWNYLDGRYLEALHRKFGTIELRKWQPTNPGFHLNWQHLLYYTVFRRISVVAPLYYMNYVRSEVDKILLRELDWINPGAHYFDDLYQALLTHIVRRKFNIDRRKFNYAALVRSGQMTREEALNKIKSIYSVEDSKIISLCLKRLEITEDDLEFFINEPPKTFNDYPNLLTVIRRFSYFVKILTMLHIIPKSLYKKYCSGLI
jgi:N-acetyl sugar amidotransferase